jgi:hypothetical protein
VAESCYRRTTRVQRRLLWREHWHGDLANLRRNLAACDGDAAALARQVDALVRQRWPAILRVACALHARGMLSGDEVDALWRRAGRNKRARGVPTGSPSPGR